MTEVLSKTFLIHFPFIIFINFKYVDLNFYFYNCPSYFHIELSSADNQFCFPKYINLRRPKYCQQLIYRGLPALLSSLNFKLLCPRLSLFFQIIYRLFLCYYFKDSASDNVPQGATKVEMLSFNYFEGYIK